VDAQNGKQLWKTAIIALGAENIGWHFASSPLLYKNMLVINAGAHGMAFDRSTGKKIWGEGGKGGHATPVIYRSGTDDLAAVFSSKALHAVDIKTGKSRWNYPWKTSHDVHAADPLVVGNSIFISSGYGSGCALLDGGNGEELWVHKRSKMRNHFSSSVFLDGYIYGYDGNAGGATVACIDAKDGEVQWQSERLTGTLVAANGYLLSYNDGGRIVIFKATPTACQVVSEATIPIKERSKCWTAPVLCKGLLYCRDSKGTLTCVDLRK